MDVPQIILDALHHEVQSMENWQENWLLAVHESHFQFPVGLALRAAGADYIVPESRPEKYVGRERLDLFASVNKEPWYIEIKKGHHGKNWRPKPQLQLPGWLNDLWRLGRIDAPGHRVFCLIHTRQEALGRGPDIDTKRVATIADCVSRHMMDGGYAEEAPLEELSEWEPVPVLHAVLERMGRALSVAEPYIGRDCDNPDDPAMKWERRTIVGCF